MEEMKNLHAGHRKRLREKVGDFGLKVLANHEIVEYFSSFSIPRKDTNELGHNLIDRFGSLVGVFTADAQDLIKVEGVGNETANFLASIGQLFELMRKEMASKGVILNSTGRIVEHFRSCYEIEKNEMFMCFILSDTSRLDGMFKVSGPDCTSVQLDLKTFAENINMRTAKSIVVLHTHPNGLAEPSDADVETTQRLLNISSDLGIEFQDHIILNEDSHYSFKSSGLLDKMQKNYNSIYHNIVKNKKSISKVENEKDTDTTYFD